MAREIILNVSSGIATKERAEQAFQTAWNVWEVMGSAGYNFLGLKSVRANFDRADHTREFPNKSFIDFNMKYDPAPLELPDGWETNMRLHLGDCRLFDKPEDLSVPAPTLVLLSKDQRERQIELRDGTPLFVAAGLVEGVKIDLGKIINRRLVHLCSFDLKSLQKHLGERVEALKRGEILSGSYLTLSDKKGPMEAFFI